MRNRAKILLARLAYGGSHRAELGTWTALAANWAATSPLVDDCLHCAIDQASAPVARNQVVSLAREHGCDVIVSIDADTLPHRHFMAFAIDFLIRHKSGPCVMTAPYVCGGEHEQVQVFRWASRRTDCPNEFQRLEFFAREEAAYKTGVEQVAAVGTGCFACHSEVFDLIKPPYFDYEYESPLRDRIVCTEDIHGFRDLSAAGVPIYVSWDHWVEAHFKTKAYQKPKVMSVEDVWGRTKDQLLARERFGVAKDESGEACHAPLTPRKLPVGIKVAPELLAPAGSNGQ